MNGTFTGNAGALTNVGSPPSVRQACSAWQVCRLFSASQNLQRVGHQPVSVAVADVNGDGFPDLISANAVDRALVIFTNNGNGIFFTNAIYKLNANPNPVCVVAADVNGDGWPDLISANQNNTLTVLTNNGGGIYGFDATLIVGLNPKAVIAVTNVDGLGHVALVSANQDGNTLTVFTNNRQWCPGFQCHAQRG